MEATELDRLREGIIAIAREAAARILEVYEGEFAIAHKADRSPVTEADLASHHCIVDGLRRLAPGIPVLSEECADEVPAATRRQWPVMWLVDPLDGTREFIRRNGEFTVNIALVEGGEPVLGVVQAPVTGALWHGQRGRGAFRRDGDEERAIAVRAPATAPLRVAASRSHRDARTEGFMRRMGEIEPLGVGSSLKFCRLAEGLMDVYPRFGPTSEWDTAAGQAVLEVAGGVVLDPHADGGRGLPLRYNRRDTILNGDFIALGDPSLPWREWLGG